MIIEPTLGRYLGLAHFRALLSIFGAVIDRGGWRSRLFHNRCRFVVRFCRSLLFRFFWVDVGVFSFLLSLRAAGISR